MPSAMAAALLPLAADVIALQECPDRSVVAALAKALGMDHVWFAARWPGNEQWPGGFPGAVLSRWPLHDARDEVAARPDLPPELFLRHWGSVTVAWPALPVRVHAYHLSADWGGVVREDTRLAEVAQVLAAITTQRAGTAAVVLCGDHNSQPDSTPYRTLAGAGLIDAFAAAGSGDGYSDRAIAPCRRIDQIWCHRLRATTCLAIQEPPFWAAADGPLVLSDHLPVMAELTPA